MENLKPMDVYAQIDVPVAVGIFCRMRRHTPEAIALQRALRKREAARQAIIDAERDYDAACEIVKVSIQAAQTKMEQSDAV